MAINITGTFVPAGDFPLADASHIGYITGKNIKEAIDEIDVNGINARIDNIATLGEGSTTGDAELIDTRIGVDNTTYANAGNAVRSQLGHVTDKINDLGIIPLKNCVITSHEASYWSNTNVLTSDANYSAITVEVEGGKNYSFPSNTYANDNFCLIVDAANNIISKFTSANLTAFGTGYYATMPAKAKYLHLSKYSTTFASTAIVIEGIKNIRGWSVSDYPIGGIPVSLKNSYDVILKDGTNVSGKFDEIKTLIGTPWKQYINTDNFVSGKYYNTTTNLVDNAGYKCIYVANMPAGKYYINSMSTPFTWFEDVETGMIYKASTGMGFTDNDREITINFDFNLYLSCLISVSSAVMWSNGPVPSTYQYGVYDIDQTTSKVKHVYYVGSTREYTKITDAIKEATAHMDSVVYVDAEEFDLVAEYGQSYLDNYATENNFGMILKNRVHVICATGCKIKFNYTGANTYVHTYFAPFNAGEHGFILENAWIESTNCRYSVHDDRATATDVYRNIYRRCTMIHDSSNCSWNAHQAIGGGFGFHGDVLIEDGYYVSTNYEDTISYHNTVTTQDTQSKCVIKNAYLSGTTLCANYGTTTIKSQMFVSNCSLSHAPKLERAIIEGRADNMELIQWGNTIRT